MNSRKMEVNVFQTVLPRFTQQTYYRRKHVKQK